MQAKKLYEGDVYVATFESADKPLYQIFIICNSVQEAILAIAEHLPLPATGFRLKGVERREWVRGVIV